MCTNAYLDYISWVHNVSIGSTLEDYYTIKLQKVQINHLLSKISKEIDIMSPIGKRCWHDFGLIMFQNCDARSAGNNQYVRMEAPCEYNATFYYVCGSTNQGFMLVLSEEREELLLVGNQSDIAQSKASAHRCLEEKFDMFGCKFVQRQHSLSKAQTNAPPLKLNTPNLPTLNTVAPTVDSGAFRFIFGKICFVIVSLVLCLTK